MPADWSNVAKPIERANVMQEGNNVLDNAAPSQVRLNTLVSLEKSISASSKTQTWS